jgi:hypothetical protein
MIDILTIYYVDLLRPTDAMIWSEISLGKKIMGRPFIVADLI